MRYMSDERVKHWAFCIEALPTQLHKLLNLIVEFEHNSSEPFWSIKKQRKQTA